MAYLDENGLEHFWGKIKDRVSSAVAPKANDADVVHKTGDEVIQGEKTFQNNHTGISSQVIIKSTDIVKGTPITPNRNTGVVFTDSTNNDSDEAGRLASVVYHAPDNEDSTYYAHLRCNNYYGSGDSVLRVGYDGDNIPYSTAPATSDDRTNSTDIVTRGFMEASEWNWQKTKKAGAVAFKPVPESDLEPVVDFMFTETPPASGEKGPENPSTISGASSFSVVRGNKNFAIPRSDISSRTINEVSFTVNQDGSYTVNGTATELTQFTIAYAGNNIIKVKKGVQYTLSGCPSGGAGDKYCLITYVNGVNEIDSGGGSTFVASEDAYINCLIQVAKNQRVDNLVFKPQIEIGSVATDFEKPLSNAYSINLGNTYYGGSLDVATGKMTVTHYYRTLPASLAADALPSNSNFATCRIWPSNFTDFIEEHGYVPRPANPIVCDKLPTYTGGGYTTDCISLGTYNAANQTSSINIALTRSTLGLGSGDISANDVRTAIASWISSNSPVIVYPLHTPYTIQLAPTQIRSLSAIDKYEPRINTVYTDQEAVQVGYQRFYDENRIAAIEARLAALEGN